MPRKTNKTAHVLNLLASGSSGEEPAPSEKQSLAPNISIVDSPTGPADPLATLIKNSLDKEMADLREEPPIEAETGITEETDPEVPISPTVLREEAPAPVADEEPENIEVQPVPAVQEVLPEPESEEASSPDSLVKAPPAEEINPPSQAHTSLEPVAEPEPEAPKAVEPKAELPKAVEPEPPKAAEPEPDYIYINLMDVLIEKRLDEFMKRFETCECDRCRQDVKALALSNLPAKYIVVPPASVAPLTSYYANKFNILIVTELTKSCLAIINNPRH